MLLSSRGRSEGQASDAAWASKPSLALSTRQKSECLRQNAILLLYRFAVDCTTDMRTIHFLSDLDTLPYDDDNFAVGTCGRSTVPLAITCRTGHLIGHS